MYLSMSHTRVTWHLRTPEYETRYSTTVRGNESRLKANAFGSYNISEWFPIACAQRVACASQLWGLISAFVSPTAYRLMSPLHDIDIWHHDFDKASTKPCRCLVKARTWELKHMYSDARCCVLAVCLIVSRFRSKLILLLHLAEGKNLGRLMSARQPSSIGDAVHEIDGRLSSGNM